jgi:hypothetical protein
MQLNTCLTVPQLYRLVCWASDQPCCIPCSKQFKKQQKKIELAQTRHKHEEQLNAYRAILCTSSCSIRGNNLGFDLLGNPKTETHNR